ncbi:ankyrin repeat domain-containing protein 6-like [Macadamia integrifolia]|uniref:ankyrin repeat domain-containing protein 6-like n=1 Tax=Macadamia integrifolia TaxID=60698 RepID=UPI001C4E4743|nr:ankyrin repeat domain-containing protein 6-like [Macadamia integrifolia]
MASTTPQLPPSLPMNPLLHKAILAGDEHTVSLFQPDFLALVVSLQGNTVAHIAARHVQTGDGDVDGNGGALKQQYLRMQNEKGNAALHEALENNHEEVARLLFTAHSELSYLGNEEGKYPVYLAAEAGLLQLFKDMLELLGDIENPREWSGGKTPLHVAIIKRHPGILDLGIYLLMLFLALQVAFNGNFSLSTNVMTSLQLLL